MCDGKGNCPGMKWRTATTTNTTIGCEVDRKSAKAIIRGVDRATRRRIVEKSINRKEALVLRCSSVSDMKCAAASTVRPASIDATNENKGSVMVGGKPIESHVMTLSSPSSRIRA